MTTTVVTPMNIQVAGRHVDVGEALRTRISDELNANVGRYFERGGAAEVVVWKDRYAFHVDISLTLASGQQLMARGVGGDAHSAFSSSLDKVEGRLRRYKRRLKNHHAQPMPKSESTSLILLRAPDEDDASFDEDWGSDGSAGAGAPQGAIIAETEASVKTLTVSMAVMELDLCEQPVVLFRNAAHGGLSVVYRRTDGNIGWIDPERTRPAGVQATLKQAAGKTNGAHPPA
jgi:ribosomal subunit interface protein